MNQTVSGELRGLEIAYDRACLKSLQKVPPAVSSSFIAMTSKIMADSTANGLHVEPLEGADDKTMRSVRLDRGYRAIGSLQGSMMLFLHVNEHDKAYRWARGRTVSVDPVTSRVRIIESVEEGAATPTVIPPAPTPSASTTELPAYEPRAASFLFEDVSDQVLLDLGVGTGELGRVRALRTEADLLGQEEHFDATSYDILVCLQAGFDPETVREMIAGAKEGEKEGKPDLSVADAIRAEEGRATIFMPKDEAELRRVLEGDLAGWRVFLHPDQRRFAYRNYNGPVLIRGGAGTGKTVVAMHRARHLADEIAKDPARGGEKILVTTFTTNLARDIEANLRTLCPEHIGGRDARIEVQNLDAWVGEFLRRRNFDRRIVYFTDDRTVQDIWGEVLDEAGIPEDLTPEFVRNEWAQVVQAQGIEKREDYFKVSRAGRGTALDRRKRAALWPIFEQFRARMRDEGLAEPDDAYREAIALLGRDGSTLPYAAVVVDEAQDMGEQAFRLIAAIAEGSSDKGNAIFIVGDAHQRIYDRKASLSSCGINIRGRSRQLRLNYRTSENIRRWAVSILEGIEVDDLDEAVDSLKGYTSLFQGPEPEVAGAASRAEEFDRIADRIKAMDGEVNLSTVCVLTRTKKLAGDIAAHLEAKGIPVVRLAEAKADRSEDNGVRVATMHRSKGLEFDTVFLCCLGAGDVPPQPVLASAVDAAGRRQAIERERSLIHVAATRAKRCLHVSWSGEPSELIHRM